MYDLFVISRYKFDYFCPLSVYEIFWFNTPLIDSLKMSLDARNLSNSPVVLFFFTFRIYSYVPDMTEKWKIEALNDITDKLSSNF